MKPAFDKHARGEEVLPIYEKMRLEFERGQRQGYRFITAYLDSAQGRIYNVAAISRGQEDDDGAGADLDNVFYAINMQADGQMRVLAILDTQQDFEGQLHEPDTPAEAYLAKPAINIPESAWNWPDIKEVLMDKPKRPVLTVIEGGKPDLA